MQTRPRRPKGAAMFVLVPLTGAMVLAACSDAAEVSVDTAVASTVRRRHHRGADHHGRAHDDGPAPPRRPRR